jgi:hypothetical protein
MLWRHAVKLGKLGDGFLAFRVLELLFRAKEWEGSLLALRQKKQY